MFSHGLTPVSPCSPPAPYLGGKRALARQLCDLIASIPHKTYAEPFVGMGGIFFRRNFAPKAEVINDRSGDVANLFRILQRHYQAFMDTMKFQLTGRHEFNRLVGSDPSTLTDLERAARFLYLQRACFGGKLSGRNFGVALHTPARFNVMKLAPLLEEVHERLAGVVIECLDWLAFLDRYDTPDTLFYLDPPYFGNEGDYGRGLFDRSQFAQMAERLAALRGRFVLSLNDRPEVREIFAAFDITPVDLSYRISGAVTPAREVIITTFGSRCGGLSRFSSSQPDASA